MTTREIDIGAFIARKEKVRFYTTYLPSLLEPSTSHRVGFRTSSGIDDEVVDLVPEVAALDLEADLVLFVVALLGLEVLLCKKLANSGGAGQLDDVPVFFVGVQFGNYG